MQIILILGVFISMLTIAIPICFVAWGTKAMLEAWRATRGTALFHAIHWGIAAWLAWAWVLFNRLLMSDPHRVTEHPDSGIYISLCLTACAGVAVLGARRPQVMAWNFVVLGLFGVMVLPLVEAALIGARSLDWLRLTFLAAALAIGMLNYLPTRLGLSAFFLGLGCAVEFIAIAAPQPLSDDKDDDIVRICIIIARLCILAAPALAWVRPFSRKPRGDLDRIWLDFRDRWGVVWGQRVREQFNRAAANAKRPVTLTWFGFQAQQPLDAATQAAVQETLTALLQRFTTAKLDSGGPGSANRG